MTLKKILQRLSVLLLLLATTATMHAQSRKIIYLQSYEKAPYHFGFLLGANFMGYSIKTLPNYQSMTFPGSWLPDPAIETGTTGPSDFEPGGSMEYQLHGYQKDQVNFSVLRAECTSLYKNIGFSVGVIGDLKLSNSFNLRFSPTLSLGSREVHYDVMLYDTAYTTYQQAMDSGSYRIQTTRSQDILATYLELPLHIKYRSHRYNNIGAYLIAGVNPKFFLFSFGKKEKTAPNTNPNNGDSDGSTPSGGDGNQGSDSQITNLKFLQPKRTDVALEFGAGYDIYNQWFKMGIEIKMGFGMMNTLREDAAHQEHLFQAPINSLKNKQLQITFTFE